MEDVAAKFAIGPIFGPSEVDTIFGRKEWLPIPRFGVEQRGKVRPVDDGSPTGSFGNAWCAMPENLQVPNLDEIVLLVRYIERLGD